MRTYACSVLTAALSTAFQSGACAKAARDTRSRMIDADRMSGILPEVWMRMVPIVAAAAALAAAPCGLTQSPPAAPSEVVALAGTYVTAYVDAFSAVVSEEKQTQKLVRPDGRTRKTREITADFLLVKAQGLWPEAFRDVIDVDGKPVKNRDDRLRKLFIDNPKTAAALAAAIAQESGRYNLGPNRRGNSPLLPMIFLLPRVAEGVRFEGAASALAFQEIRTPTVLRRRGGIGSHDMPSHGMFEIDPRTGRVLAAEFTADNPDSRISATFKVRYAIDSKLDISVPIEVTERYWQPSRPSEDVVEVRATYSSFRRFQVTTGEEIKK